MTTFARRRATRHSRLLLPADGAAPGNEGRVLAVDDEPMNLAVIDALLSPHGFDVTGITNGGAALEAVTQLRPDVILLDVMMPGQNGFQVCEQLKANPETALIPVVLATALNAREDRLRGLEAGADEFMSKPVDEVELLVRVRTFVERSRLQAQLHTTEQVLCSLAATMEAKDPVTGEHAARLVRNAERFGASLGLSEADLAVLRWGGILHDVGKIAVPDSILGKPGPLDPEEWQIMREHVARGVEIVAPLSALDAVLPIVRHHHERWDGSGYPDGLAGDQIPLLARVFQIVDIFDALTAARPYKPACTVERALAIMREEAGTVCDPELYAEFARTGAALCDTETAGGAAPILRTA